MPILCLYTGTTLFPVCPVLSPSLSLFPCPAKAYSYGKQGATGYDSDEGYGAVGYSYSTPYEGDGGGSPVISSSDEEESETEELEESLEDCCLNEPTDAIT